MKRVFVFIVALASWACSGGSDSVTAPSNGNNNNGGNNGGSNPTPLPITIVVGSPMPNHSLAGTKVRVVWTDSADAVLDANGSAVVNVPSTTQAVVVEYLGEVIQGDTIHHAMYRSFNRGEWEAQTLYLVAGPKCWTQRSGVYAGHPCTNIPYDSLLALPGNVPTEVPFAWLTSVATSGGNKYYNYGTFARNSLPACFWINRASSTDSITADDSVRIWAAVNKFQTVRGVTYFAPCNGPGQAQGANVGFVVADTIKSFGQANLVFATNGGAIISGTIKVHTYAYVSDSQYVDGLANVVAHETMHVLGMGHGCWVSVMATPACVGQENDQSEATETDLLRLDLLEAIQDKARSMSNGKVYHVAETWQGIQVVEKHLAPSTLQISAASITAQ
jgi:hypothetical protein